MNSPWGKKWSSVGVGDEQAAKLPQAQPVLQHVAVRVRREIQQQGAVHQRLRAGADVPPAPLPGLLAGLAAAEQGGPPFCRCGSQYLIFMLTHLREFRRENAARAVPPFFPILLQTGGEGNVFSRLPQNSFYAFFLYPSCSAQYSSRAAWAISLASFSASSAGTFSSSIRSQASPRAVSTFVAPGPEVTSAQPTLPVASA